jgi:tetratricopeptide (TPR) repeat protein
MSRVRRILGFFDPAEPGFVGRMARVVAVIALVAGCACAVVSAPWVRSPLGRYLEAVLLLQINQNEAGARIARSLVNDYPQHNFAYYKLLATAYRRTGQIEEQLAAYDEAARALPDQWLVQNDRCWYGAVFGHAAQVMDSCNQAVALAPPTESWALLRRGFARALTGDRQGAIADMAEGLARRDQYGSHYTAPRQPWGEWLAALKAGQAPFDAATIEAERERF